MQAGRPVECSLSELANLANLAVVKMSGQDSVPPTNTLTNAGSVGLISFHLYLLVTIEASYYPQTPAK